MISLVEKGIRSPGGAQNSQLVAVLFVSPRSSSTFSFPFSLSSSLQTLVLELEIQGHVIYFRSTQGERENKNWVIKRLAQQWSELNSARKHLEKAQSPCLKIIPPMEQKNRNIYAVTLESPWWRVASDGLFLSISSLLHKWGLLRVLPGWKVSSPHRQNLQGHWVFLFPFPFLPLNTG